MLRSLLALAAILVSTLVAGTSALVLSLIQPRGDWVFRMGRYWAWAICAASGVAVEGRGQENVPSDRPVILIANHQSNFDIMAILITIPRAFRVVAKRFLFRIPIFGWCLHSAGMIPIDRSKRSRAIQSLEKVVDLVKSGQPVLFFAEGTRSPDGSLLPFKKGAFVMAVKSGVPIVPVSVSGGARIMPKQSLRVRPGRIVVSYGPPIPVTDYTLETKEALMERVRDAVRKGLEEGDGAMREGPGPKRGASAPAPSG